MPRQRIACEFPSVRLPDAKLAACCCCIKLRPGTILISLIWLVYSLYTASTLILDFVANKNNEDWSTNFYSYFQAYTLPIAIIHLLTALASAYGLFLTAFFPTPNSLRQYAYIGYIIAFVFSVVCLFNVCVLFLHKNQFMIECSGNFPNGSEITDTVANDTCERAYNALLPLSIIWMLLIIMLSVYCSIVISAYARKVAEKEETRSNEQPTHS